MQNYIKVLTQFLQLGHQQNQLLSQIRFYLILDRLSFNNAQIQKFNTDIADQIWQYAIQKFYQKNQKQRRKQLRLNQNLDNYYERQNQKKNLNIIQYLKKQSKQKNINGITKNISVPIYIICESICQAQKILIQQIQQTQQSNFQIKIYKQNIEIRSENIQYKQRQRYLVQLYSAYSQYKQLTLPFKLKPFPKDELIQQSIKLVQNSIKPKTNIFSLNPIFDGKDLQICFRLGIIMLFLELVLIFVKAHFYNLMIVLMILSIFALNYFDRYYIRVLLINLALTSIFDMVWIINKFKFYLYPKSPTLMSRKQDYFLKFIIFGVFALIVFKFVQIALLFKYKNIDQNEKIIVDINVMRISLNTNVGKNPISKIVQNTFGDE